MNETTERGLGAPGSTPIETPRQAAGQDSLNHNVYSDYRDTVGFPPYHTNLDTGFAPGVRFGVMAVTLRFIACVIAKLID